MPYVPGPLHALACSARRPAGGGAPPAGCGGDSRAARVLEPPVGRGHPGAVASDLALRRSLTVRSAAGDKLVLVKKRGESIEHVLMKAVLWALYLPVYPGLRVEVPVGDTYKPDLVALAPPPGGVAYGDPRPAFWGEAGQVSPAKWRALLKRYPDTHFALARWDERLDPHQAILRRALGRRPRRAPVDLIRVPDAADRLLADDGTVRVSADPLADGAGGVAVERRRLWGTDDTGAA